MRPHLVDAIAGWTGAEAARLLVPTWFTFAALAALAGCWLTVRAARRASVDPTPVISALLAGYVAAVACGIAIPALIDLGAQALRGGPIRLRWAGMVSWAGFAGGAVAAAVVARRAAGGPGVARLGDLAAGPLGVSLALGRLGCFLAGCDYGQVTAAPSAVRFPMGSPAWRHHVRAGWVPETRDVSLSVHPAQLYEAALGLALFAGAVWLARREWARARSGRLFLAVAGAYAAGRIAIEAVRGDAGRGLFGPWSTGQLAGALLLVVVGVALWRSRRSARVAAAAVALAVAAVCGGAAPAHADSDGRLDVGLMVGTSAAINRRDEQVPQLGGGAVTLSYGLTPKIAIGLDADGMVNSVAVHRSFALAAALRSPVSRRLELGARVGLVATHVDFQDEAFDDAVATGARVGFTAEFALGRRWAILAWPVSVDILGHRDLGGPIISWQFRVGVAFRSSPGRRVDDSLAQPPQQPGPPRLLPIPSLPPRTGPQPQP
jgi:prolipoprotein diacylglyceryltransferase